MCVRAFFNSQYEFSDEYSVSTRKEYIYSVPEQSYTEYGLKRPRLSGNIAAD